MGCNSLTELVDHKHLVCFLSLLWLSPLDYRLLCLSCSLLFIW